MAAQVPKQISERAKETEQSRAHWLAEHVFVDHNRRCWVAMTDENGEVEHVCIGSEGTVKPALIKAGVLEGPKRRGRKPKKTKLKKVIISTPGADKISYEN